MKPVWYGIKYVLGHHLLGKRTPLICGLVLTNECNLECRHCRTADRGANRVTFEESARVLDSFYSEGGRNFYLEGGEPFLWRDGDRSLEDVVSHAHERGYFSVVVYTNGTFPIRTTADTVFISVDGLRDTHDTLRGRSFDRIMRNIKESSHPALYINYTINNRNKDEIERFCEYISKVDAIRGVFFYFHTPYYGYDDLYIEPEERKRILREIIAYTKRYAILNSRSGLESALRNDWERPQEICRVYEGGVFHRCCRFFRNGELCGNCGYLSYAETHQTLRLRPSAMRNALKYF